MSVAEKGGSGAPNGETATQHTDASDTFFFFEDEVFHIDRKNQIKFGLVVKSHETHSADEDDDVVLPKGYVQVAYYPNGTGLRQAEKDIGLADRNIMPPDIVRRVCPLTRRATGQSGYVREVKLFADLRILGTNTVIKGVPSTRVRPISFWASDSVVYFDGWVGSVRKVEEVAVLRYENGARFEIASSEFSIFHEQRPAGFSKHSTEIFFPGNILLGCLPLKKQIKLLTPDVPLPTNKKGRSSSTHRYVVETVTITALNVNWQYLTFDSNAKGHDSPPARIVGADMERVKRLNVFETSMLQLADRVILKYTKCDEIMQHADWLKEQVQRFGAIREKNLRSRKHKEEAKSPEQPKSLANSKLNHMESESPVTRSVTRASSTKDDEQDWDSIDEEDDSTENACFSTLKTRAESLRCSKRRSVKKRFGVIKKMLDSSFRRHETTPKENEDVTAEVILINSCVTVVWQDGSVEAGISSVDLYPVQYVDNHEFFPGDFVVKEQMNPLEYGVVQRVDHVERTALVKWFDMKVKECQLMRPVLRDESEHSVYQLKDHDDYLYRPGAIVVRVANTNGSDFAYKAGQVKVSNTNGLITICWANGCVTDCYPQDLFDVGHNAYDNTDDEDSTAWYSDGVVSFGDESWESINTEDDYEMGMPTDQHENRLLSSLYHAIVALKGVLASLNKSPVEKYKEFNEGLLRLYKDCRYIDRLLGTTFFDEQEFKGIIHRKATKTEPAETSSRAEKTVSVSTAGNSEQTPTAVKRKSTTDIPGHESQRRRGEVLVINTVGHLRGVPTQSKELVVTKADEADTDKEIEEILTDKRPCSIQMARAWSCVRYSINILPSYIMKIHDNDKDVAMKNYKSELSEFQQSLEEYDQPLAVTNCCHKILEQLQICFAHVCKKYFNLDSEDYTLKLINNSADSADSAIGLNKSEFSDYQDELANSLPVEAMAVLPRAESMQPLSPLPEESTCDDKLVVLDKAPSTHRYYEKNVLPSNPMQFQRAVQRELILLRTSLPGGVKVITFEDRMDLLSVMMEGPKKTPYEDALFFFDLQLGCDYPATPPVCHYISFCTDRLNPNLYESGKVCVSLLGTWAGKDTEIWTPRSTLLQVLVSIQGLILVDEPYFNEAGYEKQKGTEQGHVNSRMYNEMVIIKVVQSTTKQINKPPTLFADDVFEHFKTKGPLMYERIKQYRDLSLDNQIANAEVITPAFPLLLCSRGFCLAVEGTLREFKSTLDARYGVSAAATN